MKFDYSSLTLSIKINILFIFSFLLFLTNMGLLKYGESRKDQYAHVEELIQENKVLSQRMALFALRIQQGKEVDKRTFEDMIHHHDSTLILIGQGGKPKGTVVKVRPLPHNFQPYIKETEAIWHDFKNNALILHTEPLRIDSTYTEVIEIPANPLDSNAVMTTQSVESTISIENKKAKKAAAFIDANTGKLLKANDDIIKEIAKEKDKIAAIVNLYVLGFFLGTIIIIIISYSKMRKAVLGPLSSISEVTEKIAAHDFSSNVKYLKNDEVGRISKAINLMIDGLNNASVFVKEISKGNLDADYKGLSEDYKGENTLAQHLIQMQTKMKEVAITDQERNWATEGLTKFVDILRANNEENLSSLGDKIISNLVKYLGANQGGIFVLNEEDYEQPIIELVACYAYNRKKYLKKSIHVGEGIVGQTFIEKKTTYLLEVPKDYINIKSGLGSTNPNAILVAPLKINDEIYGVVEIASFKELKPYQIQFVEKLGESIASTLAGVKTNQKTKMLLNESRTLTEQMRAQEEEMRQNMEELSATQEEMTRKEKEISKQLSAIDTAFAVVEYTMEGHISKFNSNFSKALGYELEEVMGQHESTFSGLDSMDKNQLLWEKLNKGEIVSGDFRKISKTGNEVWLHATYCPLKNNKGNFYKVVTFAEDITKLKVIATEVSDKANGDIGNLGETLQQQIAQMELTQTALNKKNDPSNATLAKVLDSTIAFATLSHEGVFLSASSAFAELTDVEGKSILGTPFDTVLKNHIEEEVLLQIKALLLKDPNISGEVLRVTSSKAEMEIKLLRDSGPNETAGITKLFLILS